MLELNHDTVTDIVVILLCRIKLSSVYLVAKLDEEMVVFLQVLKFPNPTIDPVVGGFLLQAGLF